MQLDARDWRPQAFGRRRARAVHDPLVEPGWDGRRVLVHVAAGRSVEVTDVGGVQIGESCPAIVESIADATLAESAVIDGYLTHQATRTHISTIPDAQQAPSLGSHMSHFLLGSGADLLKHDRARGPRRVRGTGEPGPPPARVEAAPDDDMPPAPGPLAFVAVDLLAVDGQGLLDVPLLERKRILESVVDESFLVRRTPFVREPVSTFLVTWRAAGFEELAYKDPNSRYRPGEPNDAWALAPMPRG